MSYSDVDLRPAIQLDETTRGDFVVRVYQHLLGAIVAFAGIEAILLNTPFAEGIYNFGRLKIDAVPDITNVQVQINTSAPGFSPLEAEQRITFPVETAIAGLPGLEYTRSVSR